MTQVGITGHQGLPPEAIPYITTVVDGLLARLPRPLTGYTSLAEGADQLVADLVIAAGGQLHAVIPARDYIATFSETSADHYRTLLAAAARTTRLPFKESSEEAYDAAGKWIVEHCEVLIAIWDGKPARGLGGTADAVAHARALSRDVHIIWPTGVIRS